MKKISRRFIFIFYIVGTDCGLYVPGERFVRIKRENFIFCFESLSEPKNKACGRGEKENGNKNKNVERR